MFETLELVVENPYEATECPEGVEVESDPVTESESDNISDPDLLVCPI
jgi:hypothetical protein